MPNYPDHKPALCVMLTGSVISCVALVFAATSAKAQPLSPNTGLEYSIGDFRGDGGTLATDDPNGFEISPPADGLALGYRGLVNGSGRAFVLDNSTARVLSLSGPNKLPNTNTHETLSIGGVEYILLGEALQDSEPVIGLASISGRLRDENVTTNVADSFFAGADIPTPLSEQSVAAYFYDLHENSFVKGKNSHELSPLYFRPLTEQLDLAVHTYIGYEDASPGNSDPIPYTGIGLTITREAWSK